MKSLGNFPDPFLAEIEGQPGALRRAAGALTEQRGSLGTLAARAGAGLPIWTGMGSSYDACYPAVTELAARGRASIHVDTSELLHFRVPMLGKDDVLVVVSQSGESAEPVSLLEHLHGPADRPFVVSVTNGVDNPLASAADLAFDTRAGDEVGPSTMTFAAALVVVGAVGRILAADPPGEVVTHARDEAEAAAAALDRVLARPALADELLQWLGDRSTLVLLGRGSARAAAEMGALTMKESAGLPAESLETAQFRHGPLELAGPSLAAVVVATEPETAGLDLRLAEELVRAGAEVLVIAEGEQEVRGALHVPIGVLDRTVAPAVSLAPIQLLAWRLARRSGRDPGVFSRATKVTTRE